MKTEFESINALNNLIEQRELNKQVYLPVVERLDNDMSLFLDEHGYNREASIQRLTDMANSVSGGVNARVKEAYQLEKNALENPAHGYGQFIAYVHRVISEYLDRVLLGRIKELKTSRAGDTIRVVVASNLPSSNRKLSQQAAYNKKIQHLQDCGYELIETRSRLFEFAATQRNKDYLCKELSSRSAKNIELTMREQHITCISFSFSVINLSNFIIVNPETNISRDSDGLSLDEFIDLQNNLYSLVHAMEGVHNDSDLVQTCGYIIDSCVSEICEINDWTNGRISTSMKKFHESVRGKNSETGDILKRVGRSFPIDRSTSILEQLRERLNSTIWTQLHAIIDFYISRDAMIHGKICWIPTEEDFLDNYCSSQAEVQESQFSELRKKYNLIFCEDQTFLESCDKNMDKIMKQLHDLEMDVVSVNTAITNTGRRYIDEISVVSKRFVW